MKIFVYDLLQFTHKHILVLQYLLKIMHDKVQYKLMDMRS